MNKINTYFYTEDYIDYISERFGLKNETYTNNTSEYTFCAPILYKDGKVESGNLSYLSIPNVDGNISNKVLKKEMHSYFEKIYSLGKKRIALRKDPLIEYPNQLIKLFLQEGFTPNIFYTTIIDLEKGSELLWQNIRKSYRSLINSFYKDNSYTLKIVDKENNIEKIEDWIDLYMTLIRRGGGTPCEEQFKNIKTSIENNTGYLYLLYADEKIVSGININYINSLAYYTASGTHPDYEGKNYYSHYLLWIAIKDLIQRNFKKLEIGPIFYNSVKNFYKHSEKELSISDFKLGIGGELQPFYIFEKLNID